MGAAVGTLACYAVIFVLHITVLLRSKGISVNIKAVFLKPLVSALICGIAACAVLKIEETFFVTFSAILAAVVVYVICLILLKTLEEDDLSYLPKAEKLTEFCKKYRIIR